MLINPDQLPAPGFTSDGEDPPRRSLVERDPWLVSFLDVLMVLVTLMVLLLSYDRLQPDPSVTEPASNPPGSVFDDVTDQQAFLDRLYIGDLKGRVEVTIERQRVKLGIGESILFLAGDAALSHSGQQVLDELAHMLRERPWLITVEGHTDDRPIATPRYPSNWELSTARASRVTRYLIQQGLTSERLRAVGYADTHPRASNDEPEGRARNRRVELVLSVPSQPD